MVNKNKIYITAHEGCMNTKMDSIESVIAGIKYKADVIEIDLNIDKNNNLILSHNPPKEDDNYVELHKVLEIIKDEEDILLNIDIKDVRALLNLKEIISEYKLDDRVFLSGLSYSDIVCNSELLEKMHYLINIDKDAIEKFHLEKLIDKIKSLNVIGINIDYRYLSTEILAICKEKNIMIFVWTIDDEDDMDSVISQRVNSITTRKVDILKNKLSII